MPLRKCFKNACRRNLNGCRQPIQIQSSPRSLQELKHLAQSYSWVCKTARQFSQRGCFTSRRRKRENRKSRCAASRAQEIVRALHTQLTSAAIPILTNSWLRGKERVTPAWVARLTERGNLFNWR